MVAHTPERAGPGAQADPELENALLGARIQQSNAIDAYGSTRNKVVTALSARGLADGQIEDILESFERMYSAGFGQAFEQGHGEGGSVSRKAVDQALRDGLDPSLLTEFTTRFNDYRAANNTVHETEMMVASHGGSKALDTANTSTRALMSMRADLAGFAKEINPEIKIDAAYSMMGEDPANLDPLGNILSVSLGKQPKKDVAKALFHQLEPLLGDKELKLLEEAAKADKRLPRTKADEFKSSDVKDMMATIFAEHVVPKDRNVGKPEPFMKPVHKFMARVANFAKGNGFQTPEDVLDRIKAGRVAKRQEGLKGITAPKQLEHGERYGQVVRSIASLTDMELNEKLKEQHTAIIDQTKKTHSLKNRVFGRLLSKDPAFTSRDGRNEYEAEQRRLRELQRARVLMVNEQMKRQERQFGLGELEESGRPGPGGPGDGIGKSFEADGHYVGRDGLYQLGPDGKESNVVVLNPSKSPDVAIPLGEFGSKQAAATYVGAFEQSRGSESFGAGEDVVSTTAMQLAEAASRRGAGDIALIRSSGLLDRNLDSMLSKTDSKAYVYPLTTGDLIYQDPNTKAWRADSKEGFIDFAGRSGDRHLVAAAKVLSRENEGQNEGQNGGQNEGQNGDQGVVQGSNLNLDDGKPFVIKAKNDKAAFEKVDALRPDQVEAAYKATREELKRRQQDGTPEGVVARHQLMHGMTALKSAMGTQRMEQEMQQGKQKQAAGRGR